MSRAECYHMHVYCDVCNRKGDFTGVDRAAVRKIATSFGWQLGKRWSEKTAQYTDFCPTHAKQENENEPTI